MTYLDVDRRAAPFFADTDGVDEIIDSDRNGGAPAEWSFQWADYTSRLTLPERHYDLLISPYAGFVSEHCTRHLRPGGLLLVNPATETPRWPASTLAIGWSPRSPHATGRTPCGTTTWRPT